MSTATATIIVALIGGTFSFLGVLVSNLISHGKTIYRIEQLEKEQAKHNQVIERVTVLEKVFAIDEEKIKVMNKEIEKIKEEVYRSPKGGK